MDETKQLLSQENTVIFVDFDDTLYHIKEGQGKAYYRVFRDSQARILRDLFPDLEKEMSQSFEDIAQMYWEKYGHLLNGIFQEQGHRKFTFKDEYQLTKDELDRLAKAMTPNKDLVKWLASLPHNVKIISDSFTPWIESMSQRLEIDLSPFGEIGSIEKRNLFAKSDKEAWECLTQKYSKYPNKILLDDNSHVGKVAESCGVHVPWSRGKGEIEEYFSSLINSR
ncbi:MAG: HAD family hydrolase [Alphaproteobacteria bacterium]|nr:HAD family hydrolase [Alphaproteobacteria bacterium]